MWFDVAVVMSIFAFGNIFFGHFEEKTPKWRRALKVVLFVGLVLGVSATLGRAWAMGLLALGAVIPFVVIHLWWLPKQGINGWTGEPKEKYYKLRGWDLPPR
jgi:quinol-cytochrome oxidoreductase complex cytochrome b subunit